MKVKNSEASRMIQAMRPLLDKTGVVGYAAAYNTRALIDKAREYLSLYDAKMRELGDAELDEDGNETGRYTLHAGTPEYLSFIEEVGPIGDIEHEVDLVLVPAGQASESATGEEMLNAQFMFSWDREE